MLQEPLDSVGRRLIDVPGYTFRVFVTTCDEPPEEIWRGYNRRAGTQQYWLVLVFNRLAGSVNARKDPIGLTSGLHQVLNFCSSGRAVPHYSEP